MTDLIGKVAIVTGGRRGIGLAIVQAFRKAGARVFAVGKSLDDGATDYLRCDLLNREARRDLVRRVVDKAGRVDILVNNAGDLVFNPAWRYPLNDWDAQIELLLTAPFDLCQQAAQVMIEQHAGKIINIASITAFQGARNCVAYVAAKHGLIGLARALAVEWSTHNIQVNAIAPGYIDTDMLAHLTADAEHSAAMLGRIPAGRYGTGEDVAGAALYLAGADYVTGDCVMVDGGWRVR